MALRETESNAYAKFLGDKQRALWYVMVFSGVVNTLVNTKILVEYPPGSYWSQDPHILVVGIPVHARSLYRLIKMARW